MQARVTDLATQRRAHGDLSCVMCDGGPPVEEPSFLLAQVDRLVANHGRKKTVATFVGSREVQRGGVLRGSGRSLVLLGSLGPWVGAASRVEGQRPARHARGVASWPAPRRYNNLARRVRGEGRRKSGEEEDLRGPAFDFPFSAPLRALSLRSSLTTWVCCAKTERRK